MVVQSFFGRGTFVRVGVEQRLDEVLGRIGDVAPIPLVELNLGFGRLPDKFLHVVGPERRVTAEHDVCDNSSGPKPFIQHPRILDSGEARCRHSPCGPNIDSLTMALFVEHFWSDVAEAARKRMKLLFGCMQVFRTEARMLKTGRRCLGILQQAKAAAPAVRSKLRCWGQPIGALLQNDHFQRIEDH